MGFSGTIRLKPECSGLNIYLDNGAERITIYLPALLRPYHLAGIEYSRKDVKSAVFVNSYVEDIEKSIAVLRMLSNDVLDKMSKMTNIRDKRFHIYVNTNSVDDAVRKITEHINRYFKLSMKSAIRRVGERVEELQRKGLELLRKSKKVEINTRYEKFVFRIVKLNGAVAVAIMNPYNNVEGLLLFTDKQVYYADYNTALNRLGQIAEGMKTKHIVRRMTPVDFGDKIVWSLTVRDIAEAVGDSDLNELVKKIVAWKIVSR